MWKKVEKRAQSDNEAIGFWTPKVGEEIQGKVKSLVETKKYPFFVVQLTGDGGTFTSQDATSKGFTGNVVFLPHHTELQALEGLIDKEVRIKFDGREKLEGTRSICRYTIEEFVLSTEETPF